MNIDLLCVQVSLISTNCYIFRDRESGDAAVIDPGEFSDELRLSLQKLNIEKLKYILLTHGHFDHADGALKLKQAYGGMIAISKEDERAFKDHSISLGRKFGFEGRYPEKADIIVSDGDRLPFGNGFIEVVSTPGHTAGSVCYILDDLLFSGDTLFAGSCGRTDFKTGSFPEIIESLAKLASYNKNYKVLPGHGPFSDLDSERQTNPYISNYQ